MLFVLSVCLPVCAEIKSNDDKYANYQFKVNETERELYSYIEKDLRNRPISEFGQDELDFLSWTDVFLHAVGEINQEDYIAFVNIEAEGDTGGESGGYQKIAQLLVKDNKVTMINDYGFFYTKKIDKIRYSHFDVDGDSYGCINSKSVFTADINLDTDYEYFVLEGGGKQNSNFIQDKFILSVFDGSSTELIAREEVLFTNLNKLTEIPKDGFFRYQVKNRVNQSDSTPAESRYAKFFFSDFDKDGLNNLIVWRKIFISRKVSDGVGDNFAYMNALDTFTLYEESHNGQAWVKEEVSSQVAQEYLRLFNMSWSDGYPNKNLCSGSEDEVIKIDLDYSLGSLKNNISNLK